MRNWSHLVASAEVFAQAAALEEWLKAQRFWLMTYYTGNRNRITQFVSGF
jgi:hypothetical protein